MLKEQQSSLWAGAEGVSVRVVRMRLEMVGEELYRELKGLWLLY